MTKKHSFDAVASIRLTPPIMKRADKLIRKVQDDPIYLATGKVTRSTVLRLCILSGLDVLEKQYEKEK